MLQNINCRFVLFLCIDNDEVGSYLPTVTKGSPSKFASVKVSGCLLTVSTTSWPSVQVSRYDNTVSHLFAGTVIIPNLRPATFKGWRRPAKLTDKVFVFILDEPSFNKTSYS
jgi:hypothetical protein